MIAASFSGPAAGDPPPMVDQHQQATAGPGYQWASAGPCAGEWQATADPRSCVHADFADGEYGLDDGVVTFDTAYLTELASASTGFCNTAGTSRIKVIYASVPANTSRYSDLLGTLRNKVKNADYWLWKSAQDQGHGAKRHYRFVCDSNGNVDVANVALTNAANNSFSDLKSQLRAKGYNSSSRKYLVFADFKDAGSDRQCGWGERYADDSSGQSNLNNGGNMFAAVYLRAANCVNQWGLSAMHEVGHTLGSTQSSAPHWDANNKGRPRDEYDVMAYGSNTFIANGCGDTVGNKRYDCNKNDYFDTRVAGNVTDPRSTYLANHWDIADSKFLVGSGHV